MNKPHPFKGLNIRIPIIVTIRGRGHESWVYISCVYTSRASDAFL